MSGVKLESVQCVIDLRVTISANFKFSQHCKDAAGKANSMQGFIKHFFSKNKDIIIPLYNSLVRPHLEYAVEFQSPHTAKNIAKLEAVQRRDTKMIPSLHNKSHEQGARMTKPVLSRETLSARKTYSVSKYLKGLRMLTQILFIIDD